MFASRRLQRCVSSAAYLLSLEMEFMTRVARKRTYVVGPRPIYIKNSRVRLDDCVIVCAEPQFEGEPAKRLAVSHSPTLMTYQAQRKQLSCATIPLTGVADAIRRGA